MMNFDADIIVVGGGPAGLTAALYAARAGKRVTVFEGESYGGQIVVSRKIENYPALPDTDGFTFTENLKAQATTYQAVLKNTFVTRFYKQDNGFAVETDEGTYTCGAVILATGLKHRKLGVEGEASLIGRGISFCATCDGMFFRKKEVAVVGGGNTAVQDALVLSEYCSKVYLIHRRMELRAERALAERVLEKENVEFIGDTVISRVAGERMLSGVCLKNVKDGGERFLTVSGLFEAIGQIPQNEPFRDSVSLDEDGFFLTNERCETSQVGVFAAGDACKKNVRQLTTAVADGTVAALSAVEYLDSLR